MEGRLHLRCADSDVRGEAGAFEHTLLELLEHCNAIFSFAALLRTITCFKASIRADNLA